MCFFARLQIFVLLVSAPLAALAQAGATTWAGNYSGEMNGVRVNMKLSASQEGFTGTIVDPDGYLYNVSARARGAEAAGELKDPNTGGAMDLKATQRGGDITLRLAQLQLGVEVGNVIVINFSRQDPTDPAQAPAKNAEARDQRLVGKWTSSEAYVSGDFSVATEITLVIRADGTYLYGNGRIAGGDGGGSFSTGSNGGFKTGRWKSSNKILFVDEGGGWTPYSEYLVDETRLLMKFPNGSKKIWMRSN